VPVVCGGRDDEVPVPLGRGALLLPGRGALLLPPVGRGVLPLLPVGRGLLGLVEVGEPVRRLFGRDALLPVPAGRGALLPDPVGRAVPEVGLEAGVVPVGFEDGAAVAGLGLAAEAVVPSAGFFFTPSVVAWSCACFVSSAIQASFPRAFTSHRQSASQSVRAHARNGHWLMTGVHQRSAQI